jgi:hypothetical protein
MQMTFNKLYLAIVCGLLSSTAIADQCSSPSGPSTLNFKAEVDGTDSNEDQWRAIAEAIQNTYGNNVAPDPYTGVYISGVLIVDSVFSTSTKAFTPLPIPFDGTTSIEKAILDSQGIGVDEDDPNPCSAPGEDDSNASSGGGSSGGGSYGSPTLYIPEPFIADTVWNWHRDNPSGSVTATPAPGSASSFDYSSYYASQYSSFYSNYYSNYNPN